MSESAEGGAVDAENRHVSPTLKSRDLPSGDVIDVAELEKLLQRERVVIITVIGDKGAGKTSFVSAIYDGFSRGEIGEFSFKESKTILGFERRLFQTRVASGEAKPDTPHTPLSDELYFLHLLVCGSGGTKELVFTERAGETYTAGRLDPLVAADIPELKFSDHICVVVDGELLAGNDKHNALQRCRQAIQVGLSSGQFGADTRLAVIFGKSDLWEHMASSRGAVDRFQAILSRDFRERLGALQFVQISLFGDRAQTRNALNSFLKQWVVEDRVTVDFGFSVNKIVSNFDRLAFYLKE